MKKTLLAIMFGICTMQSCGMIHTDEHVTDGGSYAIQNLNLVKISDNHYYDKETRIVFLWNGISGGMSNGATIPVPYPASNGLPYKYDVENEQLVEIEVTVDQQTGKVSFE